MATLYLFTVLKISGEHDVHQKTLPINSLQRSSICKCWVCWTRVRCHLRIVVNDVTFHTYHTYVRKNLASV